MKPKEWAAKAYDNLMAGGARTFMGCVEQAIERAVEEEREACAKIVEDSYDSFTDTALPFAGPALLKAAKDIRARCNKSATENDNT